jgi:hypothetical protein
MANRRPVRWKQREATRGVKAVQAAGLEIDRVEMSPDGKITVYPAKNPQAKSSDADDIIARLK